MSGGDDGAYAAAEDVPERVAAPLADLLLVLADSKRLLGMRYADWILGAPALEASIACSAMAQDEWGHGRILYAMLDGFDRDPERLEHEREPAEYRNAELLDRPAEGWAELLALNLLLDTALTVQFEAMAESRFEPLHHKVAKLLEEERFHFDHARGWTARLAESGGGREALREAYAPAWTACLRWFGPGDDDAAGALREAGVVEAGPEELRGRWRQRVEPVLEANGLDVGGNGDGALDFSDWSAGRRRSDGAGSPDTETIQRVRGDKNRPLLMD